jgi:hypothetical protein
VVGAFATGSDHHVSVLVGAPGLASTAPIQPASPVTAGEQDRLVRENRGASRPALSAAEQAQVRNNALTVQRQAVAEKAAAKKAAEKKAAEKKAAEKRAAAKKRAAAHKAAVKKAHRAAVKKAHAAAKRRQVELDQKRAAAAKAKSKKTTTSAHRSYSGSPRSIARSMMKSKYGWGASQFGCYNKIIMRESGWNVHANNPSSSAYGIPQALPGSKMSSAGPDWRNNPTTQIRWGLGYVKSRYGTPCGAWGFKSSHGWY